MKLPDRQAFAGSVATMDRLVRNMVHLAGVPVMGCGGDGHGHAGQSDRPGGQEGEPCAGFDADIVLMDKQLNVKAVMARRTVC